MIAEAHIIYLPLGKIQASDYWSNPCHKFGAKRFKDVRKLIKGVEVWSRNE